MSKVSIKTILNNNSSNEIIEYNLVGIDYSNIVRITRKDSDKEIILEFKEKNDTTALYKIYNNTYELNIYTNKIEIKDNYIEIDYIIEDDNINYKLFVEGEI